MRHRETIAVTLLVGVMLCLGSLSVQAAGKYKLKPGAQGKLCLECHVAFGDKMKSKHVHTPLADGDCTGCHNPHASNHGKLMAGPADSICYNCHEQAVPEGAKSAHQPVAAGECVSCHDPHASNNPANLVEGGSKLCFSCHQELGEKIAANKYGHAPVEQNCQRCHKAHASEQGENLLVAEQPGLCLECHRADTSGFKKSHVNYPVENGRCTACHDPHGSSTPVILANNVHSPISKQMCNQCHNEPNSAQPFGLKKPGFELCQGCHYQMINDSFAKNRLHWALVDESGCINCHSPHASNEPGLLKAPMKSVCGSCHSDTLARQERSVTKHQPIEDGECTTCHSPHASDNLFLQESASTVETCAACHDWQTHSTHPIGADVIDPRNPNITLDCLSCHRTHGTEYKHFLYYPEIQGLCVQCHTQYRR